MGDSSPHPRLAPGPFEVVWDGAFVQPENDSIRFGAFVGGEIKVTLGGIVVLEGRGESEKAWIEAKEMRPWTSGTFRLHAEYRTLPGVPARLQLWWEGKGFSKEPLPPWRLRHLPAERHPIPVKDRDAGVGQDVPYALEFLAMCGRAHSRASR